MFGGCLVVGQLLVGSGLKNYHPKPSTLNLSRIGFGPYDIDTACCTGGHLPCV